MSLITTYTKITRKSIDTFIDSFPEFTAEAAIKEIKLAFNLMNKDQLYMVYNELEEARDGLEADLAAEPTKHWFDFDLHINFTETTDKEDKLIERISNIQELMNICNLVIDELCE